MARLAESGEGCVEARQNLPVALPAPIAASLPSTICWAKRPHAKKDDRLGQLAAAFDNVVGERAPAQLGVRVRGMLAHGERSVEEQDALLCPWG